MDQLQFSRDKGDSIFQALGYSRHLGRDVEDAFQTYIEPIVNKEMDFVRDLVKNPKQVVEWLDGGESKLKCSVSKLDLIEGFLASPEFKKLGFPLDSANGFFALGYIGGHIINLFEESLHDKAMVILKGAAIRSIFDK